MGGKEYRLMRNAIQMVAKAIADGAVRRPLAVDIAYRLPDTAIGLMHPNCTQHLPDEGWEYLGRAVLDMDRMHQFEDDHGMMCDWCGDSLFVRVSY